MHGGSSTGVAKEVSGMALKRVVQIGVVTLLILATSFLFGQEVDYGTKHVFPTPEVITPHIKWLKPYARGPLKILFVTHRAGMREIIELAQRMDINYTVVSISHPDAFYQRDPSNPSTLTPESITADGEKKLGENYDAIILGNINWSCLPISWRYLILKKAKEGTAILGIVRGADEYLSKALKERTKIEFPSTFPFKGLASFEKYKDMESFLNATLDVYQFGNGKILLLKGYNVPPRMQMLTSAPIGNPMQVSYIEYDYYLAYICHLLALCAHKEPVVRIRGKDYIEANRSEFHTVEFALESDEKIEGICKLVLRGKYNAFIHSQTKKVLISPRLSTVVGFHVESPPAGEYFADLWVLSDGKIINFGSSFIRLSSDSFIRGLELKRSYKKDEIISGKITLESKEPKWKGFHIVICQKDNFGRLISRKEIDLSSFPSKSPIEIPFALPHGKPLTVLQNLSVMLCKGKETVDCKKESFFISDLYPKDDVRYILWVGGFGSYLTPHFYRVLYEAGFDTQYTGFNEAVLLGNLYHLPYATRFIDRKTDWYPHPDVPSRTKDDHVRLPCLNDPSYLEEVRNNLTNTAKRLMDFSTKEFSMGDECHFVGGRYELCFCPHCVTGFAKFLEREYGSVENLNKEYEANFKSFSDVKPVTLEEARKDPKLIPLWVDYRRYMEDVWAGIFRFSRDVIEEVVPKAKVGYEGSDMSVNSYNAADFYKLMQAMNLNNTYDAPFIPYAVSDFSQPGTLLGLGWYGGYNPCRSEIYNRYIVWRHLFRGANSFWVWHGEPGMEGGVVAPDLSFYDFFKANVEEIKELKKGIGKLIMSAKRIGDIAILYSASSVHLSTLTEGFPQMEQVLNSMTSLLEDVRCPFKIISYNQLGEGILRKANFRSLILPYSQALSLEEAKEIADFVKGGGVVISDLRPGIFDQHGKPFKRSILDEVFGVKQEPSPKPKRGKVSLNLGGNFPNSLPDTFSDASITLTTGRQFGEMEGTPCFIVNKFGQGMAILLNFSLSSYSPRSESAPLWRSFLRALLNYAGVKERAKISPDIVGVRAYWFQRDSLQYLGILQELPEPSINYALGKAKPITPSPVKLTLLRKYHIYDVREGKYLGYGNVINTKVEPGRAKLYALFPYKLNKIFISTPSRATQGKELAYEIKLDGTSPSLGLHIVHLSVVDPNGKTIAYYEENLMVSGGKAKGTIPLALNEILGKWKIRAKDVATGISSERTFTVEGIK